MINKLRLPALICILGLVFIGLGLHQQSETKAAQNYYVGAASAGAGCDAYTMLLVHSDSTNGSQVFDDSSPYGRTMEPINDVQHSTAQQEMGATSILFDGADDALKVPYSTDWFPDPDGDMTYDFWVYPNAVVNGDKLISQQNESSGPGLYIYILSGNAIGWSFPETGCGIGRRSGFSNDTISTGSWYHIALITRGDTDEFELYIDGNEVSYGSREAYSNVEQCGGDGRFVIGSGPQNNNDFDGYMDEVRVSKGVRRWLTNFTPDTTPYCQ